MVAPLACPRCRIALALVPHHDRWVAACSQCAGVWLDAREAGLLLAPFGASGLRPAQAGADALACPHCSVAMRGLVTPIGGIEIDRCTAHGVWFDRDEMAHVADLVARMSGRAPPGVVPPPYREAPAHASWGPAAGVVAAGAVAGTAAAMATGASGSRERESLLPDAAEGALDGAEVGHAAVEVGAGLVDAGGDVASAAVEAGGSVIEGAGDVLGSVFEALGGLFS